VRACETLAVVATAWGVLLGCGGTANVSGNPNDGGGADHTQTGSDSGQKNPDASGSEPGAPEGGSSEGGSDAGDASRDASDGGPMPTEWMIVSTPLDGGVGLYGVGGYTTLDVWAVGGTATGPADIFWAGTSWANIGLVTSTGPLLSVSTSTAGVNDSWSVTGPTVLNWDGTGWHTLALDTNTTPLTSILAPEPGHAFAVGNAGTVLECVLATTACTPSAAGTADLTSVWGIEATNLWTVGKGGVIYAYDGAGWSAETGIGTADLYAVSGSDDIDLWAVGDAIEHSDGSGTWTKDPFTPPGTLHGVYAAAPNEAWAVGKGGIILAWDGKSWKSTTSPTTNDLYAVWGANEHQIWAVGANNTVLERAK
jgi:hypothetical protein